MPLLHGAVGAVLGHWAGLSVGGTAVLATMAASASYIAAPPAVRMTLPDANPTLSLTAYVRARPAPGPLRIRQWAQSVDTGRVDEVCEVWDADDRLVAHATQLAAIRIPEGLEAPPRA